MFCFFVFFSTPYFWYSEMSDHSFANSDGYFYFISCCSSSNDNFHLGLEFEFISKANQENDLNLIIAI